MRWRRCGSRRTTTPPNSATSPARVIGSTIKSGTNEFHGNGFEYWRDSSMAANSWDNNRGGAKKAELSQHIFGATIGGPIIKNKLFFFGDYQGFHARPSGRAGRHGGAGRRGARATSRASNVTIRDPQTGQPFPGNQHSDRSGSARSRARSWRTSSCIRCRTVPGDSNNLVHRIVRQAARPSGRRQGRREPVGRTTGSSGASRTRTTSPSRSGRRSRASWSARTTRRSSAWPSTGTARSRATSVNELLVGFTQSQVPDDSRRLGRHRRRQRDRSAFPAGSAIAGLSNFNISGGVGFGDAGIAEFNDIKSYQLTEKFSWFKGRHQLKFGGRWLYQQQGFSYSGNEGILGHFDYSGTFTGFGFADFLLDQVSLKGRGGAGGTVHSPAAPGRRFRAGRFPRPQRSDAEPRASPGSTPRRWSRRTTGSRTSI